MHFIITCDAGRPRRFYAYEQRRARGAEFLTPPVDRGAEVRCYKRDPTVTLIEIGQATTIPPHG